jgi:hypothetical protein
LINIIENGGCVYWYFTVFEEAFYSVDREALWSKMRRTQARGLLNCIQKCYEDTKFRAKCGDNEETNFAPQTKGVRRECNMSPHSFNNVIIDVLSIGDITMPGLLCADDLAVSSFTSSGLQMTMNHVARICKDV